MIESKHIIVDPPSSAYYENKFFYNSEYNRDNCLLPNIRLKSILSERNIKIDTYDLKPNNKKVEYYSFGILYNIDNLINTPQVKMKAFFLMEPPCVVPEMYNVLPKLTKVFECVYIHNVLGDGYSLKGVNTNRLKKLYWAQCYNNVITKYWENTSRLNKIVIINSNKRPKAKSRELYSERIKGIIELNEYKYLDLYGMNWKKTFSRTMIWSPYLFNYKRIMSVYKGEIEDKYNTLSKYDFCLCYENDIIQSYITEKIFDCFYAGTIPIYLGAPDIDKFIPSSTFIDARNFNLYSEMYNYLNRLTNEDKAEIKNAGRDFITSSKMDIFYNSLINVFAE